MHAEKPILWCFVLSWQTRNLSIIRYVTLIWNI